MKLKKSVLLSIALFGAGASIFSYAAVTHNVTGATAEARGQHFKTLLNTAAAGDEIVFAEEVKLLQGTGNLNIPNVTIKGNNSVLHLEGYNLNLTGAATFDNLKLSLVPTRTISESFASFGNKGAEAKPTLIVTNGYDLTLNAVTTKVEKEGENAGTRPILLLGGGNSSKPETLTITNSTTETKLYGIAIDGKKSLNSNGELIENSTDSASNAVTLNIGSNTNVLGGISVSDNDEININSKSSNLSKIDTGNTTNVNLTISEVSSVGASGVLNTNPNAKFKSLNLDGVVVTLQNGNPYSTNNISIDTLSLKDGGGIKSGNSFNEEDNLTVVVDNLKSEGKNTLALDSGKLEIKSAEIKSGTLGVRGDLTFPDNIDTDEDGNYVPPKREETPPPPPEEPSSPTNPSDAGSNTPNTGLDNTGEGNNNPNTQPESQPSGTTNTENTGGGNSNPETTTSTGAGTGTSTPEASDTNSGEDPNSKQDVAETATGGENNSTGAGAPTGGEQAGGEAGANPSAGSSEAGSSSTPDTKPVTPPAETTQPEPSDGKPKTETPTVQPGDATTENGNPADQTGNQPANPSNTGNAEGGGSNTETNPSVGTTIPGANGNTEGKNPNDKQEGTDATVGGENNSTGTGVPTGGEQAGGEAGANPSAGSSEAGSSSTPDTKPVTPPAGTAQPEPTDVKPKTETPTVQPGDATTENGNPADQTGNQPANPSNTGNAEGGGSNTETNPSVGTTIPGANGNTEGENPNDKQEGTDATVGGENNSTGTGAPTGGEQAGGEAGANPSAGSSEAGSSSTPETKPVMPPAETTQPEPSDGKPKTDESGKEDTTTATNPNGKETEDQTGSENTEGSDKESVETTTDNGNDATSDSASKSKDDKTEGTEEGKSEKSKEEPTENDKAQEASNSSKGDSKDKAGEGEKADKPAEMPKEKPAEKSIKDRIMDMLKGWFTSNNLDEKQQQQVAEKTEESLKDLTAMYTDYDFSFSLDALRVTENRLNNLTMFNDLEYASNDNYAFLAQSAKALKMHNSVWVSSSLSEQRGDNKRRLNTINLGYDRQIDNLILGGFVSYLRQKGERGELSSKLHGYAFSLYGKYNQNSHEVVALLNTGRTKADLQRNISAFGINNKADAKGNFVGVRVEYGYRIPFDAHSLQIKPLIGLNYNLGRQAAFTEYGTMPVHVDKIKAQRLSVEAGVELRKYFETAYVYVKPTIQTDVMARSNDVDIRFVDTPNSIPFKSVAKKKTYFALSLGTQLQLRKNLLLDLSANSRMGKHERDIQGNIRLNYKF